MKNALFVLLLAYASISANCQPSMYERIKDGREYKIFTSESGKLIISGDIIEMGVIVKYRDSVVSNTYNLGMPKYVPYDISNFPQEFKTIFKIVHIGDSIIVRVKTDDLIKKNQGAPFMKKGEYVYQYFKVINAYSEVAEADKAREANSIAAEAKALIKSNAQRKADDFILSEYFKKNKIQPIKTKKGAYVQIFKPGVGVKPDSNKVVKINYTGRYLNGEMFDSNTDPAKGHVDPLIINLTNDTTLGLGVIAGMAEGLKMMYKGAVGKIFIPSGLAYGPEGGGGEILPNAIIVFDVEVVDVFNKIQARTEKLKLQNKMEVWNKNNSDNSKNKKGQ